MICLCWNVRVMGNPETFRSLRALNRKYKPQLVFLFETKMTTQKATSLKFKLSFQNCFSVPRSGMSGGLLLLWNSDANVEILSFSKAHIDILFSCLIYPKWRFTDFYGEPNPSLRNQSWTLLKRLASAINYPWLLGGDFNKIMTHLEKKGVPLKRDQALLDFCETFDNCNLTDLGWKGYKYTWCNMRKGRAKIEERLNRFLADPNWSTLFPNARVHNITTVGSDHFPILINFNDSLSGSFFG